jgi:carbamoyl-phosphate synthase small subunit
MKAILALEDGTIFEGESFGAKGEKAAEVVFNTSMSGYQEIITDPSYKGQFVCMTYPLIGNYGVNKKDVESAKPQVEGFIIKELAALKSNWRADDDLDSYLKKNKVIGIQGIDTRMLTLHIRKKGSMKAVISTKDFNKKSLIKKANDFRGIEGVDLVKEVTIKRKKDYNRKGKYKIAVIDCGVKYNILRELAKRDCRIKLYPAKTKAADILESKPDGVFLSNGPGDPQGAPYVSETIRELLGKVPMFGICLGQQMLGLALGGTTFKLKFGHHGANHPVKDIRTNKIAITAQNHNFCVDIDSLKRDDIEITHMNLNDQTLEGIKHRKLPVFAVQFHPEAGPGPNDAKYIFDEFIKLIEREQKKEKRKQKVKS